MKIYKICLENTKYEKMITKEIYNLIYTNGKLNKKKKKLQKFCYIRKI